VIPGWLHQLMGDRPVVRRAMEVAWREHAGVTYDNGPYLDHVIEVASRTRSALGSGGSAPLGVALALTHDVAEDTDLDVLGVADLVVPVERDGRYERSIFTEALILLTNDLPTYAAYVHRLTTYAGNRNAHRLALAVKRADLETNVAHSLSAAKYGRVAQERWGPALVKVIQAQGPIPWELR